MMWPVDHNAPDPDLWVDPYMVRWAVLVQSQLALPIETDAHYVPL